MSLAKFAVTRPVFVSMFSCIILILGGVSLRYLPVDLMPEITYPAVTITTTYEDASPDEVEELVTTPIESSMSAVSGVKEVKSTSAEGTSSVRISFTWGTHLEEAVADVRDRLDRVTPGLPDDVDNPIIRKFDSAAMPIMRIGVATHLNLLDARRIVEDQISYRLERIDGVASVDLMGGLEREIHVLIDEAKARNLDTTLDTILATIESNNITTPAGNIEEGLLDVRVRTPGTFTDLEELRNTVIARGKNGDLIRVRDIAEVIDTYKDQTRFVRFGGSPGIMMAIYKQSGANTVSIANEVEKELAKINDDYRGQFYFNPAFNTADYIKSALSSVSDSAITGGLLAIIVLLLFLRNIGSTLTIALSIPFSVIATFALIYFNGFTLNIMTLGGLALGIGMLVDNAIVVLENISRLHDEGMEAEEAAIQGTTEVTAAIIASTLTTLAVFLPLLFMQGMSGIMFKQFSTVVAFSLGCSLITAITIVPTLAARLLKKTKKTTGLLPSILATIERGQKSIESGYSAILSTVLNHRWFFLLATITIVSLTIVPGFYLGSELMPKTDENEVNIYLETEVGTRPEIVNEKVKLTEDIIRDEAGEELKTWISFAGASSWRADGGHKANYVLKLKSRNERTRSDAEIAAALGERLANIPGTTIRTRSGAGLFSRMMGSSTGEAVSVDVRGYDFDTAAALAHKVQELSKTVAGVTDSSLSRDLGTPEDRITIDREKAADLKVSVETIADTLRTILAGSDAGEYRDAGEEYTILVKVKDADLTSLDRLLDISVRNEDGERVVLRNLLKYERVMGPVTIERKNQERIITVGINIFNRDMGSVIADLKERLDETPLPPAFEVNFVGDYEDQQEAFNELLFAFALALILVYMVMACQFESFVDPLIVMLSVPLAGSGVVTALLLTDSTWNLQSFIGSIMLAGIVVNNAILLVDTANLLRERDKLPLFDAVREAGRRRLRPIMMTTLTTVLGLLPLALGYGDGGEMQAPMARAVIGGLTSSTLVTLLFIPAIYYTIERIFSKK